MSGVKIENKVKGIDATVPVAPVEVNGVKVENKLGPSFGGGGGGSSSSSSAGYEAFLSWFLALCIVGGGGWLFLKFRPKRASA